MTDISDQREIIRRELRERFEQGLEEQVDRLLAATAPADPANVVSEAIGYSERLKEELESLDEMIQVYERVERAVMENPEVQKNNLFFGVFQWAHADSLMIRLRRLTDDNRRTGSLWYLCKFISRNAQVFDRQWYMRIYKGTVVEAYAPAWWGEVSTEGGEHVCPEKMSRKANDMRRSASDCADWISQNIAHLDRSATAPVPTWGTFHSVLDEVRELFKNVHGMLTGHSCDCRVTIAIDWEHCLMVPWMAPSRRFIALKERRQAEAKPGPT